MRRFPEPVREAMSTSGAAATCVPVQLEPEQWEAAFFIQMAGAECKADRRIVKRARGPLPVGLETDVIETEHAAVVVLRPEIHTTPGDPFTCEILLTPGEGGAHFEALKLLASQPRLCWFIGDQTHWLLHSQQHALDDEQHAGFEELLRDAVRHDSVIRMTQRYDAQAALGHYELRAATLRADYVGDDPRTRKRAN